MPSPFPGMDPFLEDPGLWPDFHHRVISIASDLLAASLRPKYFVRIEERVYVSSEIDSGRSVMIPDVRIGAHSNCAGRPFDPFDASASVDIAEPIVLTLPADLEIHESRLEIIDRASRLVVTVIEVLSPANKLRDTEEFRSFRRKRDEVMRSQSHWVEIDFLRMGREPILTRHLPPHEYLVHISRNESRPKGIFWAIRLSQRLPKISIPLMVEDQDARLDLQAVINTAYDRAGYDLMIDYAKEPASPLASDWAEWAERLLLERGLRV